MENEFEIIQDIQQMTVHLEKLTADEGAFNEAHAAYEKEDGEKFEAALSKVGIAEHCRIICRFFCRKHCGRLCFKFCPRPHKEQVDAKEILAFARAITPLLKDEKLVKKLLSITQSEDLKAWNDFLKRYKLEIFCYQLCALVCSWRCKGVCHKLCPALPLITNIGNIPVSQIDSQGYGSGTSVPPGYVGAPNPAAGYGDHPFGGSVLLKGIFNMASGVEYLVEISSTGPIGLYTPILVGPQAGYDVDPVQPPPPIPPDPAYPLPATPPATQAGYWDIITHEFFRNRSQSTGADPGWFKIRQLTDSDGGRLTTGEKLLMMWPTGSLDGVYHLRLKVRNGGVTRTSSPQVVRLDNTGTFPLPKPTISLQLQKPDGTLLPLKCGKVRRGDGLILVTIHAYDPNMSSVSVTARGNSGLSVPVVSTTAVPLSKTYNGNVADQGYPLPTQFLWDPWSDPRMVPCCYLVYVEINDRTIINNAYYGGHSGAGWEAIEIGF